MLARAAEKASSLDDGPMEDPAQSSAKRGRGRPSKQGQKEEFSTIVLSVLSLVVSALTIPEEIKPNKNELSIFSDHLTGLLVRHLPISNKMSEDTLDIIGLFVVTAGWYARVAPQLKQTKPDQPPEVVTGAAAVRGNGSKPAGPISAIDPGAGEFLTRAGGNHGDH